MVKCYKNCVNCGYHEHMEPCCQKPCCPPSPCCSGVPCEHDITCCEPACMRPCWDTCKCMDEILKLKQSESKDDTKINNIDGRVEKVEKDVFDFNQNLTDQIGRLALKEQHDFDCLNEQIQEEVDRATAAENALNNRIEAEENRAKAKEDLLENALNLEIQRAIDREDQIDNRIAQEEQRALNKESELELSISDEHDRAIAEESRLDNRITNEELRAQNRENSLDDKIETEKARAINNEARIEYRISYEEGRAQQAESVITNNLAAETAERLLLDITDVDYNRQNKTLDLKRQNGTIIKSIDITDFIKDGMIDTVRWDPSTRELVITWNTDSGKDPIVTRIPGSDIFNPNDYYTKIQIDAKERDINTSINLLNTNLATTNSSLTTLTNRVNNTVDYGETIEWGTTETLALVNGTPITAGIPEFPNVISNVLVDNNGHLVVYDTDNPLEPHTYDLPAGYINRVTHLEEITEQQLTTINNLINVVIPALETRIQALEGDSLWYLDSSTGKVTTKNSKAAAAYGFYDTDPNMR